MKLKKLTINNFRQFYGEHSVEFSTNESKNVTLIHAENGTGKTAFLNAILWCFFETTTSNFKDKNNILNNKAKSEGKFYYNVSIDFINDDGCEYRAIRGFRDRGVTFHVFKFVDGAQRVVDNPNSFINSVVPKDMAKYFFFQGEGIGRLSGSSGSDVVRKALHEILGFTIAELALDDIKNIKRVYQREKAKSDKSGLMEDLQKTIEDLEDSIVKYTKRIDDAEKAEEYYSSKLDEFDEQLRTCDSEVIKQLHKQSKLVDDAIIRESSILKDLKRDRRTLVSEYATVVFGNSLAKFSLDFIDEDEYKKKLPAPYNIQLVQDILKEYQCICGADIRPGSEAFKRINDLLSTASDPALEGRIRKARARLIDISEKSNRAHDGFKNNISRISSSIDFLKDKQAERDDLSVKIQGTESIENIGQIEKQKSVYRKKREEEQRVIHTLSPKVESCVKDLKKYRGELNGLNNFSGEVEKWNSYVEFSNEIEKVLEETLNSFEKDVVERVIVKVNSYLAEFVRQDYGAKIDPNTFDIRLVDRDGNLVSESDGQLLLLNLTFIASLIEMSRERRNARGQILTPGAIAPFVVDAPFGDLDNKYKGNVAKTIPESVDQVIFLLSSSHWSGSVEEAIRNKVGAEYNMVLEVQSSSDGKNDDHITILGNRYETVRYDCEIDRTVFEKVGIYA